MEYAAHMVENKTTCRDWLGYQKKRATWKMQGTDGRNLKWI